MEEGLSKHSFSVFPQLVITQKDNCALFLPSPEKPHPKEVLQHLNLVIISYPKYTTELSEGQEFSDFFFYKVITKAHLSKSFLRKGINFGRVEKQNKTLSLKDYQA